MAKVTGARAIINALKVRERQLVKKASVVVGYQTNYALYIHEKVEMKWRGLPRDRTVRLGKGQTRDGGYVVYGYEPTRAKGLFWGPQGQAKYLEQPFRELANELATLIRTAVKRGATLEQALLMAGLQLQRESQVLVPVDTGNLKNSAFTKLEKT